MINNNFNSNTKTVINKSLNFKTMTNNYLKNTIKFGVTAMFIMAIGTANAQTDPTIGAAGTGTESANTTQANKSGETIKLIDNKGTIKYMQSNNGITTITSTAGGNKTTTTWQLGGTLIEDTYIDASGVVFAITGISAIDATNDAVNDIAATAYGASGFTLLVRDELTGETKKLLATDLVSGVRKVETQLNDASTDVAITVLGLPVLSTLTSMAKLFVFRNGVKLIEGTDFVATAGTVTITYDSTNLPMYAGDIVEIQYIK